MGTKRFLVDHGDAGVNGTCDQCKKQMDMSELRPYGPNNSMICYDCGHLPEFIDIVEANMKKAVYATLDKADAEDSDVYFGPMGVQQVKDE